MDKRTALIADPSEEVCAALSDALRPEFRVICCGNGVEALEQITSLRPDILILELSLPRLDGIGLLRQIRDLESIPQILVHTDNCSDFVLNALQELNVSYAMRKPTPIHIVAERVRELLQPCYADPLVWETADILLRLSIPEPSQGYRHLLVGLPLLASQPQQFLGKTFYLEIAARNNAITGGSVEKSIRDALHAGWDHGDRGMWHRYFPGISECPQNKQFLTRIASLLSRHRRCG